ncbi:peptidylprolyl isomerase [Novosphingobium bradum]|uniref:peptidylprolyl isomerase n=1 Tax=Novosphingobium bradum TaxID=1737444 RepID=A0ABV7INT3_9SPHN
MNRRFALVALIAAAVLGAPAAAAPRKATPARPVPPPPPPAPLGDTVRVIMVTELGPIELALDHGHAPVTVENFMRYVDGRRFDGMTFYRAMRLAWGDQPNGLVQTGLRGNPAKVFKPIAHEPTSQTGIRHKAGTLSMARWAPGTATADFSILLSDLGGLDANPEAADAEARAGYAAFGRVVSGMDVVRRIWDSPLSPTAGEGALKGQMLEPPVKVLTVRRAAQP